MLVLCTSPKHDLSRTILNPHNHCYIGCCICVLVLCSVLVDMTKTAADFRAAASKALEALADGLLARLRPVLDEVGSVSCKARSIC